MKDTLTIYENNEMIAVAYKKLEDRTPNWISTKEFRDKYKPDYTENHLGWAHISNAWSKDMKDVI